MTPPMSVTTATTQPVRTSVRTPVRTPTGVDARMAKWITKLRQDGGFTVSPRTGQYVTSGYAVSTYPEAEHKIGGRVQPQDLRDYAHANAAALLADGNVFGAWHNSDDGLTYLDVTTVVHDREQALRLAREHDQKAIFDLRRGIEIKA